MSPVYELSCAEVHLLRCAFQARSSTPATVVDLTREHGEAAHGFTGAWYSPKRLVSMSELVTKRSA